MPIGLYPKYHLIFIAYQVQGWQTMIIRPEKLQMDGIDVK